VTTRTSGREAKAALYRNRIELKRFLQKRSSDSFRRHLEHAVKLVPRHRDTFVPDSGNVRPRDEEMHQKFLRLDRIIREMREDSFLVVGECQVFDREFVKHNVPMFE